MFGWLSRWLKKYHAPIEDVEPDTADKPERGLLSTHSDRLNKPRGWTLHDRLKSFMSIRPSAQVKVDGDGTVIAMDASDTACSENDARGYLRGQHDVSEALALWYASQGFIGHQLSALVAQHWLIMKACLMPGRDAIRHGFTITNADGDDIPQEILNKIKRADKRYGLTGNLKEFIGKGRVFGVRVCIFKVDYGSPEKDKEAYGLPFNIDGVKPDSYKGMIQVDPYWCAPELDMESSSQSDSMHFYEPTYWLINGTRYHRTHLRVYRHGMLPDILKPAYQYGGFPVPQLIMERVYGAERTANEAPLLALTKRTMVYKTDVAKMLANADALDDLAKLSELWNNHGTRVIGTDDDMVQMDTGLSDMDALIMTQYQLVAAAAEVPATKLLGTSAKGFNATGEFDEASYHESLESIQTHDLTPLVEHHHMLVVKSLGINDLQTAISWEPLDSPTAKEYAETNKLKAETGAALVQSGAIDGVDERKRIANDKNSDYSGIEADKPIEEPVDTLTGQGTA